jgi:hypothetical protein
VIGGVVNVSQSAALFALPSALRTLSFRT